MLSDEQRREVLDELEHYPTKQAACIEALKIVQKHDGWVSDDALKEVAVLIGMPASELDSVATFFNLIYRRPVGKHVILLCDSVSCWLMAFETPKSMTLGTGVPSCSVTMMLAGLRSR